jgi:hypothetical protein
MKSVMQQMNIVKKIHKNIINFRRPRQKTLGVLEAKKRRKARMLGEVNSLNDRLLLGVAIHGGTRRKYT